MGTAGELRPQTAAEAEIGAAIFDGDAECGVRIDDLHIALLVERDVTNGGDYSPIVRSSPRFRASSRPPSGSFAFHGSVAFGRGPPAAERPRRRCCARAAIASSASAMCRCSS